VNGQPARDLIRVLDCAHRNASLLVTTAKTLRHVEEDSGKFILFDIDIEEPDAIQVEIACPDCGHQQILDNDLWEFQ
jgi:hypothetical protein